MSGRDNRRFTQPDRLAVGRVGARQVIAMCEHTDSAGQPKLVVTCDFEVTAPGCVDTEVTDLALLRRTGRGFRLEEIARGFPMR